MMRIVEFTRSWSTLMTEFNPEAFAHKFHFEDVPRIIMRLTDFTRS